MIFKSHTCSKLPLPFTILYCSHQLGDFIRPGAHVDVIYDRHFMESSRYLIGPGHTHLHPLVSGVLGDLLAFKEDLPGILFIGSHKQVKHSGLTGAVRAHQTKNLSFFHVKRHVVHRDNAAEFLGKTTYLK